MFYIDPSRRAWTEADFFARGREVVEAVLAWVGEGLQRGRMLEIGCGVGRLLGHFAEHFEQVDGVDIAPEMIERARALDLPANVRLGTVSGRDLAPYGKDELDFVFSFLVFQHIPDSEVIAGYMSEIRRVLKEGGRAVIQFDTRPATLVGRLAFSLPDPVLPRTRRRFIRRYRRSPEAVIALAREAGLTVEEERGAGTALHFLLLRPGRG